MANAPTIWLDYRPVRIGWVIEGENLEQLYTAVGWSSCLWGGRFNPAIPMHNPKLADCLIKAFNVDVLIPISPNDSTKKFIESYPHLDLHRWGEEIFRQGECLFVDVRHATIKLAQASIDKSHDDVLPIKRPMWDTSDPLKTLFGIYFGHYPSLDEIKLNYADGIGRTVKIEEVAILNGVDLHPDFLKKIKPIDLTTYDISIKSGGWTGWLGSGLVLGNPQNFDDLAFLWNLRAAGAQAYLFDIQQPERQIKFINEFIQGIHSKLQKKDEHIKLWSKDQQDIDLERLGLNLQGLRKGLCSMEEESLWNGLNIKPVKPQFTYWHHDVVPSFVNTGTDQKASFAIPQKPFSDDRDARNQQYVVTVAATQYGELPVDGLTFNTPYVPQMNEFYGRNFHFEYDKARVERDGLHGGRIGLIRDIHDQQITIHAISTHDWIKAFFKNIGIKATRSNPGLICSRLISQLGGVQGCRVFKVKGARKLLNKYGPDKNFTRGEAETCIGDIDPTTGKMNFGLYEDLYIEARKDPKLQPRHVFDYLLSHDVFRPGLEFKCPNCELQSWIHLDEVKTMSDCVYCGHSFHVGKQLKTGGDWRYRRTGLFGREDNQLGAIPVSLVLQQLDTAFKGRLLMASTSINFKSEGANIEECESDFFAVLAGAGGIGEQPVQIILGEVKTHMPFNEQDVGKLRKLADAIPADMADVFILFAKTDSFTDDEVKLAQKLNSEHKHRVILWSERELEPYHVYEGAKDVKGKDIYATTATEMAQVTHQFWFSTPDKKE